MSKDSASHAKGSDGPRSAGLWRAAIRTIVRSVAMLGSGNGSARRVFDIDPRSLTFFRIALGSLVIADLIARSGSLADHYSDWGLLPRRALVEEPQSAYRFCLHAWSGATWFEALLFAAAGALGVAFALGRGGTVVTGLLWVLTVSLQNRNYMLLNKGDQIIRLLLLWSMFMPLRARGPLRSAGGAGLLIQVAAVWMVSAWLKTGREWFPDGTAVYYALQMDHGTTAFGHWLGRMFLVTKGLTYGTYFLEWIAPLLLVSPVYTAALRGIAIVALTLLHIGFGMSLRLGLFPAVSICSLLPFIPGSWWDSIGVPAAAGRREGVKRSTNALAGAVLLLVLWLNLAAVSRSRIIVPRVVDRLAQVLRVDQTWAMFAPYPYKDSGWFVIPGRLVGGQVVDAYHGSLVPPIREKPVFLSSTFPNPRWLYYMTNLSRPENARERPWFARYLCRRFDAAHVSDLPLQDLDITFFREWALAGYQKKQAIEEVLWHQSCDEPGP